MKIKIIFTGKTDNNIYRELINEYFKRLKRYGTFIIIEMETIKKQTKTDIQIIKETERKKQLSQIEESDYLVLLDEKGELLSSVEFSKTIERMSISSKKCVVFLIGGAYGFSDTIYKRANFCLSLSKMTFNHQMVRIILLEQIYRAYSILHNEPYHNS